MRLVVLISGNGSNLKSLIDNFPLAVVAVISNNPKALGLQYANDVNIKQFVVNHHDFISREEFDSEVATIINKFTPDLVVLAGFMRILSNKFVNEFTGRLINIHPSLLPKYKGVNTHQRVLATADKIHGATVHFVSPELDSGEIILQQQVPILANDTPDILARRVLQIEHQLYPAAIRQLTTNSQNSIKSFKLEDFFPYKIRLYHKAVSDLLSQVYKTKYNLSVGEWRVIVLLNEMISATSSAIIDRSSMGKVIVSRIISRLEQRKIIQRQPDNNDKRRIFISLTVEGERILSELIPVMQDLESKLLACLNENEIEQLQTLMTKIRQQVITETAANS